MHHDDQVKHIRALKDWANEIRAVASSIDDEECRATLARPAVSYESMVEVAQKAYVAARGLEESCTPR